MVDRFNITILSSRVEDDAPEGGPPVFLGVINRWLESQGHFGLVWLDDAKDRNTTSYICSGCNRGYDAPDGFVEIVLNYPWREPETVVLIVQPEDGAARVLRPLLSE